ncbi:MAG TPA: hypothetical protein PLD22_02525, partial [Bacillota bacterium]|nr:hypothetical protein [Bacillota bacterium]
MGGIAHIYTLKPSKGPKGPNELSGFSGPKRQLNRSLSGVSRRHGKQRNRDLSRMIENIRHRRPTKPISNENGSLQILFTGW